MHNFCDKALDVFERIIQVGIVVMTLRALYIFWALKQP